MIVRFSDGEERKAEWVDFWQENNTVLVKIRGGDVEYYGHADISEVREEE